MRVCYFFDDDPDLFHGYGDLRILSTKTVDNFVDSL